MATSSITISALTATPTLRGNKLKATVVATGPAAVLPNLMTKTVVFKASTTNDYATATEVARGNPEALDNFLVEEQTYYYWAYVLDQSENAGAVYPVSPTGGVACTAIGMSGLAFGLANGKLVASVSANALTISLKTAAGNDPSASDPVYVAFRNSVLTTGNYVIRAITSALSLTIPSGKAFSSNSELFRLWGSLFDTGIGVKLAISRQHASGIIVPLDEYGLKSASDISAVAYSLGTLFADATITSRPVRTIGYIEWTTGLADATLWTVAPHVVQMLGPGVKLPGDPVGISLNNSGGSTVAGSVIAIPLDDTPPLNSEGAVFVQAGYTPKSGANALRVSGVVYIARSTAGPLIAAIFRDDVATPIDIALANAAADDLTAINHSVMIQAVKASQIIFDQRYGGTGGATVYFGQTSTGRKFGGYLTSKVVVEEFMG